jgi:PIN domain nuclease of toxin-antitoxin system
MNQYVLDACALIAFFQNERGAERVADVPDAAEEGKAAITIFAGQTAKSAQIS